MKAINKICQILTIVFGIGALILFFVPFANVVSEGKELSFVGAQLGFGGGAHHLAKSSHILFCFLLTAIAALMSVFSFKSKGIRYANPVVSLVAAVYMLVIALSKPAKFVDRRPLTNVTKIDYTDFVMILVIVLFALALAAIAYLFIDDKLEVLASKGAKKTICQRIGLFFRDNKSEVKKIVWPSWRDVVKNTVIVLIMCLIVGVLIWAVDFGLAELIKLILGVK